MPFNINSFRSHIEKSGYLLNNKFEVAILPPPVMQNENENITEYVRFRSEGIVSPGINLITYDIQRYGIGTTSKYPIAAQLNEINISFVSDKYGDLWAFWHNWAKECFQHSGIQSDLAATPSIPTYTAKYKEEYATTGQITVFNQMGERTIDINLYETYPVGIREIPLDWNDSELVKIDVVLTYKEFIVV